MEEEFEVKFSSEGTIAMSQDIDTILGTMGCTGFNTRATGVVKAVVEKVGGKLTKQKLVWGDENDPKFNESQMKSATTLLAVLVRAVEGAGDPAEGTVKFVVKK